MLLFLLKLQKRALFVRELFHVVSHYFRERKSGKFVWHKKKEDLCLRKKKKKKAGSREKSEKTKKMNNELNSCIGLIRFRRVVLKCACHKIANGEEEKNFLHFYSS